MQMTRLFEIVYILLVKGNSTAAELAERFEVSARTIYRDIDALSAAGIPVYASKGKGGGIRLDDSFVLNKSLLSDSEQNEILTALQSLGAASFARDDAVLDKLGALFNKRITHWIEVDFSDWSHNEIESFNMIKRSILGRRLLCFDYYSSLGEKTRRTVEPDLLWFKHSSWYLRAFCLNKNEHRLFKLSRMKRITMLDERYEARMNNGPDAAAFANNLNPQTVTLKLKVDKTQLYRIYDEFDESNIERCPDGSFIVEATFPEDEWVYGFVLSFGHYAEVLEPGYMREIIKDRLQKNLEYYL